MPHAVYNCFSRFAFETALENPWWGCSGKAQTAAEEAYIHMGIGHLTVARQALGTEVNQS